MRSFFHLAQTCYCCSVLCTEMCVTHVITCIFTPCLSVYIPRSIQQATGSIDTLLIGVILEATPKMVCKIQANYDRILSRRFVC